MASGVLIDENGIFNTRIEQDLNLVTEREPVAVVSIIGAQSSGKSTLLNQVFKTDFKVMDPANGMCQTTKGIWVAQDPSSSGGFPILVIDTEGSDGAERQDDVKFEKQTALFSLAVSDTVIMNMKCDNVNLHNAGGWAPLRALLEVMLRRFSTPRKVNLVFVLRDKNEVPLDKLKSQLVNGVEKRWTEIIGRQRRQRIPPLKDYFQIEVVTMSHHRREQEEFDTEVASLREQIKRWTTSGELSREKIPASDFVAYAIKIWNAIKEDPDLDLPNPRIVLALVRCTAIAEEKYKSFHEDKDWLETKKQVDHSPEIVQHFGQKVSSIYNSYLNQYEQDAGHYDDKERDKYKKQLAEKLMKEIEPTYRILVDRMSQATLKKFLAAAEVEINRDTALDNMKTEHYTTELQELIEDAAIEGVDPAYAVNRIAQLKSRMDSVIANAALVVEHLDIKEKLEKINKWKKFAIALAFSMSLAMSLCVAGAAIAVAPPLAPALVPAAPALVASLLGHSTLGAAIAPGAVPAAGSTLDTTLALFKALRPEDSETVESLASRLAPILRKASEDQNNDGSPPSSEAAGL